jgi:hypothetical protein
MDEPYKFPPWLAHVIDFIFENLPEEQAKPFMANIASCIPHEADVDQIKIPILVFILRYVLEDFDHNQFPDVKQCLDNVIHIYEKDVIDLNELSLAMTSTRKAAVRAAEESVIARTRARGAMVKGLRSLAASNAGATAKAKAKAAAAEALDASNVEEGARKAWVAACVGHATAAGSMVEALRLLANVDSQLLLDEIVRLISSSYKKETGK